MIEFDCVDCGRHIYDLGRDAPPADGRCAVCQWIVEFLPAEEQPAARQRLGALLKTEGR